MRAIRDILRWRFDVFERYEFCVKRLNRKGTSIFEIGAGEYSLEYFGFKNVKTTEISGKREYLDITKHLPDNFSQFDVVVAIDVLEHIAPKKRMFAIRQMLKIAKRKIILSTPNDLVAYEFDKKLDELFIEKGYYSKHLKEHIKYGFFDVNSLIKKLRKIHRIKKIEVFNGIDLKTHEKIALFCFHKNKWIFLLKNKLFYLVRNLIISHSQTHSPYHKFIEIILNDEKLG